MVYSVTSWNSVPEERERVCTIFMFVFVGVQFTAFVVLEHVMNAVNVCITETQNLSCFIYFLYEPKFSLVREGMSCSLAVMYSVSKPYSSETSKSEPGYALLAIISSEHIQ